MKCKKMNCLTHKIDCLKNEIDNYKCKLICQAQDVKNNVKIDDFHKTLLGLLIAAAGTAIGIAWLASLENEEVISTTTEEITFDPIEPSKLLFALKAADDAININSDATGPFQVTPLEYDYTTLEPAISEATLRLHHDSIYKDYVDSLNAALAQYPETYQYTLPELLLYPDRVPFDIRAQIFRHAGGTYNHGLLWKTLGEPNKTEPTGAFLNAINKQFGSFENLKDVLTSASESIDTTGYSWLALNPYGRLIVVNTEDEFTPIPLRMVPLLPIDVWEHAHYVDYKGQKEDYLNALYTVIDWNRVGDRYNAAIEIFSE